MQVGPQHLCIFQKELWNNLWSWHEGYQKYFSKTISLLEGTRFQVIQAQSYFQYTGFYLCLIIKDKWLNNLLCHSKA